MDSFHCHSEDKTNNMTPPTNKTGKVAVVLGARGGTGKQIVHRLCERPSEEISEIRAVLRDNNSSNQGYKELFPKDDRVIVHIGDVTDLESLRPAFKNANYIFNATSGSGSKSAKIVEQVDRDSVGETAKLVAQEFSDSVERYVLVTSQLVHPSNKWHPVRIMLNTVVTGVFSPKGVMDFKWEGEELLRNSGIPYTIVRPGHLIDGPYPGGHTIKVQVGQTNKSFSSGNGIARSDVAEVCIAAAMSDKAKNTTFELSVEKQKEGSTAKPAQEPPLVIPEDLFDNLHPRYLETKENVKE